MSTKTVLCGVLMGLLLGIAVVVPGDVLAVVKCPDKGNGMLPEGRDGQDLEVTGTCTVGGGRYTYGNVNIWGTPEGQEKVVPGILKFTNAKITFSARSILVENNGYPLAGWSMKQDKPRPISAGAGGRLTIRLYGSEPDEPIACKSGPTCGVDPAIWKANSASATQHPKRLCREPLSRRQL